MHGTLNGTMGLREMGNTQGLGFEALTMQLEPDVRPAWYLAEVVGGEEKSVAAHLIGRRFGIFMPEMKFEPVLKYDRAEDTWNLVRSEKPLPSKRLMIPGYIFVFCWMSDKNFSRLCAVPGVQDVMRYSGGDKAAVFDDSVIHDLRAIETVLCPIDVPAEWRKQKRRRHGWRKHRKEAAEAEERSYVAPRSWIHLGDGQWIDGTQAMRVLDMVGANHLLAKSLGLAS